MDKLYGKLIQRIKQNLILQKQVNLMLWSYLPWQSWIRVLQFSICWCFSQGYQLNPKFPENLRSTYKNLFHRKPLNIIWILKGVFAKNERGYKLIVKNNRFWSVLILLLSVGSIRRKLLKTTHTHTNSEIWS